MHLHHAYLHTLTTSRCVKYSLQVSQNLLKSKRVGEDDIRAHVSALANGISLPFLLCNDKSIGGGTHWVNIDWVVAGSSWLTLTISECPHRAICAASTQCDIDPVQVAIET